MLLPAAAPCPRSGSQVLSALSLRSTLASQGPRWRALHVAFHCVDHWTEPKPSHRFGGRALTTGDHDPQARSFPNLESITCEPASVQLRPAQGVPGGLAGPYAGSAPVQGGSSGVSRGVPWIR